MNSALWARRERRIVEFTHDAFAAYRHVIESQEATIEALGLEIAELERALASVLDQKGRTDATP